jgi:hypothetical protein
MNPQANAFLIFPLIWIFGLLLASVAYRKRKGKSILFFTVPKSIFIRHTASGFCRNRIGSVKNCLVVAISHQRLVIRPFTPFNLMFFPEAFGLEHDVPLNNIISVSHYRYFFRSSLRVLLRDEKGASHEIILFLQCPEEFLKHLPAHCITA